MTMRSRKLRMATSLAAIALSHAANASASNTPPIKPGLWEIKTEREIDGRRTPDLSDRLKNLSPEARERMKATMKDRGVDLDEHAPDHMRLCLTRESLESGRWKDTPGRCETEFTQRSSAHWKWRAVCSQPASTILGEAVFTSPEIYIVQSQTTTQRQGQDSVMTMKMDGKWLGPDCGDLAPAKVPTPPPVAP